MLPGKDQLNICFAHSDYRLAERFAARGTGIGHFQVRTPEDFAARLPEADVVVVSMLWRNELLAAAKKLKFIQSVSAGMDRYDADLIRAQGIRLASAARSPSTPWP
jgi:phosphoglycerate dehydrogenase-like enzyme